MRQFKISFDNEEYFINFIDDAQEYGRLCRKLRMSEYQNFGIDIETAKKPEFINHPKAGLDPKLSIISTVQIYDGNKNVYVIDTFKLGLSPLRFLDEKNFVAHYAVFEISHFLHHGINLNIGCSMLLSILVDRAEKTDFVDTEDSLFDEEDDKPHWKGYGLDAITGRLFDVTVDKKFQTHDWSARPIDKEAIIYGGLDAILTYKIAMIQFKKVADYKMLIHYKLLKEMQYVIVDMESMGVCLDKKKHRELINTWMDKQIEGIKTCKKYFGDINLNSSKQLHDFYTKIFTIQFGDPNNSRDYKEWKKTKTGQLGFDKNALAPFQHRPEIKALLEHKKTAKLISTYGESLQNCIHVVDHRIHCSFTLGETRTGRLSSREPNLQNMPRESSMRDVFCAEHGYKLIIADFNQIELRVAGEVSGDPIIKGAYAKGEDLHRIFAAKMYGINPKAVNKEQRQIAKSANFGAIYGMGANKFIIYTLASTGGLIKLSFDQAKHTIDSLWTLYGTYGEWCKQVRATAEKQGFVRTPLGKMRRLHPKEVYTKAPNTIIQGGAFEVMSAAMIRLRSKLKHGKIINSVHDEIIVEVQEKYAEECKVAVESAMVNGMLEIFPKANTFGIAVAAICDSWGEKK